MFKKLQIIAASVGLACISATLPAAAAEGSFVGTVMHVSTNNIKVQNDSHKTLSFELVPHFKSVFSSDGKTTYQMNKLRPGTYVRVMYDQHFLGMRHADKIIYLNRHGRKVKVGG